MKNFNPEIETKNIIKFIKNHYKENKCNGAVIGISGGKDSAVVAALFVNALGKENVVGVWMPCHSKTEDMKDAQEIANYFGIKLLNFDLTNTYDCFKEEVRKTLKPSKDETINPDINLKPRLRMATLYYITAFLSSKTKKQYLVVGTSNKAEIFVGYFTKWGDGGNDIATIADYTVEEVIKIGEYLDVPKSALYKTPDDGLSGKSDEEKLGVKYSEIATYMENPKKVPAEIGNKIKKLHEGSMHKFNIPTYRREL